MNNRLLHFLLYCAFLLPLSLEAQIPPSLETQIQTVNIGVVLDGPAGIPTRQDVRRIYGPEIVNLLQGEFDVRIPAELVLMADGTPDDVNRALDRLFHDPTVDLVLAGGAIASYLASTRGPLPKPTIASVVINPQVQGIPLTGKSSGVRNLNYIAFPTDVRKDLETSRAVVAFDKAAMLFPRGIQHTMPHLLQFYFEQGLELGIQGVPIPVDGSADAILDALPADVEAVVIAFPLHLPKDQMKRLADGLIERRLPSFSAAGLGDIEAGIMVALHPAADLTRLMRRIALHIQRILLGEEPGDLPVVFSRRERLTINMATARAIGISPSWAIINEAELINHKRKTPGRLLTLSDALNQSLAVNLDLAAKEQELKASAQEVRLTRATLWPQIDLAATGAVLDPDIASPAQPERSVAASATLTQLIYSDQARAGHAIQQHLQEGRRLARDQLRLDIIQATATAYLNVLRSKTFEQVQKENLELTRSNLELARVREAIGYSGRADVFRWESQIATARQRLIKANAQRNLAEIELNRILHRPLEERFSTADTAMADPTLPGGDPRFNRYLESPRNFAILRQFQAEDGLNYAPELKAFDAAINAQKRALSAARRAFWSPSLALQGSASRELYDDSIDSQVPLDENNWTLGLNLRFPLYSGGAKNAQHIQARATLERLHQERQALAERLEQRIRSAIHVAGASYAAIQLSQQAATAAHKNLDLVKDAYGRGIVPILDLLDAQNAAILAAEGASNAGYNFLVDLVEVERSLGRFFFFTDSAEKDAWFQRLETYFDQAVSADRD